MVSYKAHKYATVNIAKNRMLRGRLNWQRLVISIGYSVIVNATAVIDQRNQPTFTYKSVSPRSNNRLER